MNTVFEKINASGRLKEYINVGYLAQDEKHRVLSIDKFATQFGERIFAECEDFKTILPNRFAASFTEEVINEINTNIQEKGLLVYLVNNGPVGRSTNVEFVQG